MKTTIIATILMTLAFPNVSADSYLYWMFDNYNTGYHFDNARLGVVSAGGTKYLSIDMSEGYTAKNGSLSFLQMFTNLANSYSGEGRGFLLELLNDSDVSYSSGLIGWDSQKIVSDTQLINATPLSFTVKPVPEPTSGIFLFLGIVALALKRRRRLVVCLTAFCALVSQAAYDDTMICFRTSGPDRYADGSIVLDGERYALVWTEDESFDGFKADGTPVNTNEEVLVTVPFAKDGRCQLAAYPLSSGKLTHGGTLSVWLLDTRVYAADGTISLAASNGTTNVTAVAAAAKVTSDITISRKGRRGFVSLEDVALAPTAVPVDVPRPIISALQIDNDTNQIYLTVTNTASCITYGIKEGSSPTSLKGGAAKHPVTGGGTITLITEKTGDTQFFSVGRHE